MATRKKPAAKKNTNLYYIVGAVVAALVVAGILIAVSMSGGDGSDKSASSDTIAQIQENVKGIPASGLVLGKADAPVTITEFADIACPHCQTAALEVIPKVTTDLVRSGKAKLEFVPTVFISASSERGALGVLAAAKQNAAWPFAEALYHIQGSEATDWLSDADMEKIAEQLGLDIAKWKADYTGSEILNDYQQMKDKVATAGVNSTPTFVITGPGGSEKVEGAVPAANIAEKVNQVATRS